MCVERGEGDLCGQCTQGIRRSPVLPRALTHQLPTHLGWRQGADRYSCVCGIHMGTTREEGVPTVIIHLACQILQYSAHSMHGLGMGSPLQHLKAAASLFCISQPTLSNQTSGFFKNYDEAKTKKKSVWNSTNIVLSSDYFSQIWKQFFFYKQKFI